MWDVLQKKYPEFFTKTNADDENDAQHRVMGYWRTEIDRISDGVAMGRSEPLSWHEKQLLVVMNSQRTPFGLGAIGNGTWQRESVFR